MSGILAGPWCDKILSSGESVTTLVRCAGMALLPINRLGCLTRTGATLAGALAIGAVSAPI